MDDTTIPTTAVPVVDTPTVVEPTTSPEATPVAPEAPVATI